ncbi:MAG TPA: signal peptidase I [Solirubrobacterales bacterium]|nr:signal peptidase I [Solirubrobacterales bacterium]
MASAHGIPRQIANGFGWAFLVAGVALAVAVAGPLAIGDHPRTDLTGSMEPTIAAGDVVINEQISPSEASVGDIVTFRDPEDQSRELTHRVVRVHRSGGHYWFVTRGDANTGTEHWRIAAGGEIGRLVYIVPWVGHVAVLTRSPLGWGLLLIVPLLLLAAEELRRIWRPHPGGGDEVAGDAR